MDLPPTNSDSPWSALTVSQVCGGVNAGKAKTTGDVGLQTTSIPTGPLFWKVLHGVFPTLQSCDIAIVGAPQFLQDGSSPLIQRLPCATTPIWLASFAIGHAEASNHKWWSAKKRKIPVVQLEAQCIGKSCTRYAREW